MERYAIVGGVKSRGYAVLKAYHDKAIYSFLKYGRLCWCGNNEDMRDDKKQAFLDVGVPNDYFLQAEMRQFLRGKGAK